MLSHANTTGSDVWEVMLHADSVPGLGSAAIKAVSRFAETMEGLSERAVACLRQAVEEVLILIGVIERGLCVSDGEDRGVEQRNQRDACLWHLCIVYRKATLTSAKGLS